MKERIVKIARNILFMLSIPAVVGAFAFAKVATKDEVCNEIIISFSNNQLSFVTQKNISELLNQKGVVAHQTKLRSLNISDLENNIALKKINGLKIQIFILQQIIASILKLSKTFP